MATLRITIDTDNEAFGPGVHELVRLLHNVGVSLTHGREAGIILDANGNTVGRFDFEGDDG